MDLDYDEIDQLSEQEKDVFGKAFLETVRTGRFDEGGQLVGKRDRPVAASTVRGAASAVASALRRHLKRSPFHDNEGRIRPALGELIAAYQSVDPPKKSQRSITPKFLMTMYKHFVDDDGRNHGDTMNAHFVDLYLGMFFFAGRCCEYCVTKEAGRTKRLTVADVTFRDDQRLVMTVDNEMSLDMAKYVTLRFKDQKNRVKGESRTQGRTGNKILDPVSRLGYAVLRIKRRVKDWSGDTELCTIGRESNVLRITEEIALETVRSICRIYGGSKEFGFDPSEIGNRSLRSGAAMALALSPKNHPDLKIKTLGRWKSDAFLAYIRPQILELTSNLAGDMVENAATYTMTDQADMRLDF